MGKLRSPHLASPAIVASTLGLTMPQMDRMTIVDQMACLLY